MKQFAIIAGGVLLLLLLCSSVFTVDRTDYVYLTQFGRRIATFDGATDGGLHWKWPWPVQAVLRLDRRMQFFDLPETEMLTREKNRSSTAVLAAQILGSVNPLIPQGVLLQSPALNSYLLNEIEASQKEFAEGDGNSATTSIDKNISVSAYVCWRIADREHVDLFIRRIGTAEQARKILGDQIKALLAATIGQKRLDDLISTEQHKVDQSMAEMHRQLLEGMQETAEREYGVTIVDIRLRRTNHPIQVRETIFERIRSERKTKAERERDEGTAIARTIQTQADADAQRIRNNAEQDKRLRMEEGQVKAGEIRLKAYSQDREFAEKLIQMTKVLEALNPSSKNVILVSMRDLFWKQLRGPDAGPSPIPPKKPGDASEGGH